MTVYILLRTLSFKQNYTYGTNSDLPVIALPPHLHWTGTLSLNQSQSVLNIEPEGHTVSVTFSEQHTNTHIHTKAFFTLQGQERSIMDGFSSFSLNTFHRSFTQMMAPIWQREDILKTHCIRLTPSSVVGIIQDLWLICLLCLHKYSKRQRYQQ